MTTPADDLRAKVLEDAERRGRDVPPALVRYPYAARAYLGCEFGCLFDGDVCRHCGRRQ